MTPFQQLYLGMGVKKKTYLDDVYSTHLYLGDGTNNRSINNGIDLAGEGGLVLLRARNNSLNYVAWDTERGASRRLDLHQNWAQGSTDTSRLNQFNSNGFRVSSHINCNYSSSYKYVSNTFRKSPGFFDVVSWTGNGTNGRQISHNLGSVPGCIMVKCTSHEGSWSIYHRGLNSGITPEQYHVVLNSTNGEDTTSDWNDTAATSTNFTVSDGGRINANNQTYVAYLFAGGESTAATARSVGFNGTNSWLTIADHADFDIGTNWTAECWFKCNSIGSNGWDVIMGQWSGAWVLEYVGTDLRFYYGSSHKSLGAAPIGQWHHVAISKEGSTTRIFLNGKQVVTDFDMGTYSASTSFNIGGNMGGSSGGPFNGEISNVRIVQGTAVYTSSFNPPTEPLTNITNTKLLCCNNSSTTGSTVTPGTITSNGGNAAARAFSPFDDPAGFVYGDSGKEAVIKTGGYKGDGNGGSSQGTPNSQEVYLGWEPQLVLIKRVSNSESWILYDSMRGIDDQNGSSTDRKIEINTSDTEANTNHINLTSTGFTFATGNNQVNANNDNYIYLAIRRPDGYVGKPPEVGTSVFTTAVRSSSTAPRYISNFPVDFALYRNPSDTSDWYGTNRLNGGQIVKTNVTEIGVENSDYANFDHSNGYSNQGGSGHQAWMWKRHAGFDVVTYEGTQTVQEIKHSMNKAPEMMWIKNRDNAGYNWSVYHSGLGDNRFKLYLNTTNDYSNDQAAWNNTAPTSTHFTLGTDATANKNGDSYTAMLFASISGISKCGVYNGATSNLTLDLGFQPRLFICKQMNAGGSWMVFDSVRGMGSGNDSILQLDSSSAANSSNRVEATSSGITLYANTDSDVLPSNTSHKCIYYAHA